MRVVRIDFDEAEELEAVTVRLSAAEAAYIATFTGKHTAPGAVIPGGEVANHTLYEGMAGGIFNRLYDGGVSEWVDGQS